MGDLDMPSPAIRWMFHTTAMVPDYDVAVERLAALGGLRVLEYGEHDDPAIGRRGGMCWIGDNSIEIGQPIVAGGGAARFVERTGGGMHSIAVQVHDVDATVDYVESHGVRVAARPLPEMCFTDPRDTDGVFVEWGAFELAIDPRFDAPIPDCAVQPLLEVCRMAFVGAVVSDPGATADKLARLFGTEVTFRNDRAPLGEPGAGVSVGDCTLALYAVPGVAGRELWGAPLERPRCHLMGLAVRDLDDAVVALRGVGIPVIRHDAGTAVLDPAATGGIAIALVESLLPGDPRLTGC
jgi:catechol 2,3-dioxygenase-like lactoylglutathione lyase family enzyme